MLFQKYNHCLKVMVAFCCLFIFNADLDANKIEPAKHITKNTKNMLLAILGRLENLNDLRVKYIRGDAKESANKKEAVFVVGMPRSGTSCVAGVLQILGVDFGKNLFPANQFNEKGYFEDYFVHKMTWEMLHALQMTTAHPRIIDWAREPKKEEFKIKAKDFMRKFNNKSFGIKLPDASFVLPVYLESMQELGYTPKLIIVLRDPDEIVQSWRKRWNISEPETYAALSKLYLNIIRYGQEHDALAIYFDDILTDTEAVVNRLNNFIAGLKSYDEVKEELAAFIDVQLKHHKAS